MSVLVPANGFAGHLSASAATADYMALGPLAVGSWLRSIVVEVWATGTAGGQDVHVGLGLGGPGPIDVDAFLAARSLLQGEDGTGLGWSGLIFNFNATGSRNFQLFPGAWVPSGPIYLLVGLYNPQALVAAHVHVAAEMMRVG